LTLSKSLKLSEKTRVSLRSRGGKGLEGLPSQTSPFQTAS
jgi:hypothetical protein